MEQTDRSDDYVWRANPPRPYMDDPPRMQLRSLWPKEYRSTDVDTGERRCSDCDEVKVLADFPRDSTASQGRKYQCRVCHNRSCVKRYRDKAPAYDRASQTA